MYVWEKYNKYTETVQPCCQPSEWNHNTIDEVEFTGKNFDDFLQECEDETSLTLRDQNRVKKSVQYVVDVYRAYLARYPESEVFLECSFLDSVHKHLSFCNISSVLKKLDPKGHKYDKQLLTQQYQRYRVDKSLDLHFTEENGKDPVAFFVDLYNYSEYSELAKMCLHLYTISPDSVECERAISNLNLVKTVYRTSLTAEHLQAALRLALEKRSPGDFPWSKFEMKSKHFDSEASTLNWHCNIVHFVCYKLKMFMYMIPYQLTLL